MKLYGIRYAKDFKYGTKETVFSTQKGNREPIADFSFFYYLAEADGKHFLFDTGFRDGRLAAEMGVSLFSTDEEIRRVFGSFPEIDAIFLTHSHWDHMNALISLVEVRECFYDRFHFEVIGGHTPDSSVLYFQTGNDTY